MREKIVSYLCEKILGEDDISKPDLESSEFCGRGTNYKKGIYFLFNKNDQVIYVGHIKDQKSTSLYDRIKGHGSGSHSNSYWYTEVEKGKFLRFNNLTNEELLLIERLSIFGMNQPIFNDKDTSEKNLFNLHKIFKL